MAGTSSGAKKGWMNRTRSGRKKVNTMTDFSKAPKVGSSFKTIGRKGSKTTPTSRVKLSKAALKRREEKYGKEASDKMGRYN